MKAAVDPGNLLQSECEYNIKEVEEQAWAGETIRPAPQRAGLVASSELFCRCKGVLTKAAYRANPILGNIFPCSAGCDAAVRIADYRIVNVGTGAFILHYGISSFKGSAVQHARKLYALCNPLFAQLKVVISRSNA